MEKIVGKSMEKLCRSIERICNSNENFQFQKPKYEAMHKSHEGLQAQKEKGSSYSSLHSAKDTSALRLGGSQLQLPDWAELDPKKLSCSESLER